MAVGACAAIMILGCLFVLPCLLASLVLFETDGVGKAEVYEESSLDGGADGYREQRQWLPISSWQGQVWFQAVCYPCFSPHDLEDGGSLPLLYPTFCLDRKEVLLLAYRRCTA